MAQKLGYQNLYLWQGLTKSLAPQSIQQLKILPCVVFLSAKSSEIHVSDDVVKVKLFPYTGLKGFINKFRYKNKDAYWGNLLAQNMMYFLPKNKENLYPKIEIEWAQ